MKSALQILAATGETKMQPIQVSTPQKGINPRLEDRENYDVDTYWELNEDNEDGFENRCMESKNFYLVDENAKRDDYQRDQSIRLCSSFDNSRRDDGTII